MPPDTIDAHPQAPETLEELSTYLQARIAAKPDEGPMRVQYIIIAEMDRQLVAMRVLDWMANQIIVVLKHMLKDVAKKTKR